MFHSVCPVLLVYKRRYGSKLMLIMTQSALWVSQLQFFSSVGFVLLFFAIELGLAWLLLFFRIRSLGRDSSGWLAAYRFWVRVFALSFFLGFSASIPVLLQLGSLWPALMDKAGNVVGPLVAAGIVSAFVFKSCFLGAMLFGQRRLSGPVHVFAVGMVAVGLTLTAMWFVALLSWMHVPQGASYIDGAYQITDWLGVLWNPAFPWYAGFVVLASFLTAAFLVLGVVAAQTLHRPVEPHQRLAFATAAWIAPVSLVALVAVLSGSVSMTVNYQPARAAATAAYWHSGTSPDLVLFALPDADAGENDAALAIRDAGALLLGVDAQGQPRGLDQFAGMMPPVALTFWSFRIAFIGGLLMILVAAGTLWRAARFDYNPAALSLRWRYVLSGSSFLGWVVLLAGFAHVLFGAYPFVVHGTVTLSEIQSDTSVQVLWGASLVYWLMYAIFFIGFFHMLRHIARFGVVPVMRNRGKA